MTLLDPKFRYVHSSATDIRRTFARIRRAQAQQAAQAAPAPSSERIARAEAAVAVAAAVRLPAHQIKRVA